MFNLEKAIQNWKRKLRSNPAFEDGDIAELESHLREEVERLKVEDFSEEEAFNRASEEIGEPEPIGDELYKMRATSAGSRPPWEQKSWLPTLLPNFLKTFIRNFWRQKTVALINIFGLTAGIACCIFISLYVWDELSYDAFHTKGDRIFRIVEDFDTPDSDNTIGIVENALGPIVQQEVIEVEKALRLSNGWRLTAGPAESARIVRDYFIADSNFFEVLDFPLKWGDVETALIGPGSVVLTENMATNLFGQSNPVGETIRLEAEDFTEFGETGFTVTGVLHQIPDNSHLQFELLLSRSTVTRFEEWNTFFDSWDGFFSATYLLLDNPANREQVEQEVNRLIEKYRGKEAAAQKRALLQPLSEIHFYSSDITYENNNEEGQLSYIYLFSLIAMVILIIACINYMNLTTARSVFRAKEVALRKTAGADRTQIMVQFLGESILTAITAMILTMVFLLLLLSHFNELTGKHITYDIFYSGWILFGMAALALIIGIGAGVYPAFFLSGFQPVKVLKGKFKTDNSILRKGLVVVQFTLSIVIITVTIIAHNQMQYIREKNLGFNEDRIIVVDINHDDLQRSFMTVKEELQRSSAIAHVTVSSRVPADWKGFRQVDVNIPAGNPDDAYEMYFNAVDENFLKTYNISLSEGRNFRRVSASDSTALVLNQSAADLLFQDNPVGKVLTLNGEDFSGRVIGVVDDFHYQSLHEKIQPLVMGLISSAGSHPIHGIDYFSIKVKGQDIDQAIAHIKQVHAAFDPVNPVEYSFLDQWIADMYQQDTIIGRLFGIAAALAIIIACIGLIGLAAFFAEKRAKEIGIRKVMGATVSSIMALLSKDFLKLISIAMVISVPVALFVGRRWLENFAYRVDIGAAAFFISGGIALLIVLLAVSGQSLKAALANPVKSLRSE